jgi:hypothetical protein
MEFLMCGLMFRAAALLIVVGAVQALRAEEEPAKQTLKYKVLFKGKKVGWANAFIDCVSPEPALWSGPVGSTKNIRLLFAARGEVGSAAVSIIGREKKVLFGREAQVTHYQIKGALGSVEEWRPDDGALIRSNVSAPIDKITLELLTEP